MKILHAQILHAVELHITLLSIHVVQAWRRWGSEPMRCLVFVHLALLQPEETLHVLLDYIVRWNVHVQRVCHSGRTIKQFSTVRVSSSLEILFQSSCCVTWSCGLSLC